MDNRFRPGDVVDYKSERDNRWCREGTAIVEARGGGIILVDTYWESMSDAHVLTPQEVATARVRFNVADYYEVTSESVWERYAPADREVVTAQHGLRRRYYVRKGASEDLPTQVDNARSRLEDTRPQAARCNSREGRRAVL